MDAYRLFLFSPTKEILMSTKNFFLACAVIIALAFVACETEPEHVHQWGSWSIVTPATCTTAGSETRTCKLDSSHTDTQEIAIDPDAHDYQWTQTTKPTRGAEGEEKGVCTHDPSHTTTRTITRLSPYIITGSGTTFTVTADGETITNGTGAIADVITAIRTDANGDPVTIQFGDGTSALDIGTASASFNNTDGTWGAIILTGKITSANVGSSTRGTVNIGGGVSVNSTADIANTGTDSTNSTAIYQSGANTNTIISGGTVSGGTAIAVYITSNSGNITISGTAMVTSANTSNSTPLGTIYNYGSVTITGGTVQNTGNNGTTVYDASGATVTISGGTVSATGSNGNAVGTFNTVTLSGNPEITGWINLYNSAGGSKLSLSNFNPTTDRVYTLNFATNTADRVAVTGGANFINNFALPASQQTSWKLAVGTGDNSNDLVLASNP